MKELRYLLPFVTRYRPRLIAGMLCVLGMAIVGLFGPVVVGHAVDRLRVEISSEILWQYALVLFGLAAVQGIFSYGQRMILVVMSRDIERDLRDRYFAHLSRLSQGFFQRSPTGDLMARATNDLEAIRLVCGPAIMYSANTMFTGVGALILMARVDVPLTLVSLALAPLVGFATHFFGQRIHRYFQRVQEQFSTLSTRVQENFAGARVVRAYVQEAPQQEVFDEVSEEYVQRNRKLIQWTSAFHPLLATLIGFGFVAVLGYGGWLTFRGQITVGQLVEFNLLLGRLAWPMIALGWVVNLVQRGAASMSRVRKVLEETPEIVAVEPIRELSEVRGGLRFEDLEFRYGPELEPVLRDIDVRIEAGMTVALVGRTGAGKSTFLSLIPRLLDPPAGGLLLDGVDVRHLSLETLRRNIGTVPQETFLFSATVAENIAFGRPEASPEEVLEAARLAGLEQDLELFPNGLETVVGERGITLSGGQKQRVALARALLRRPRILLLDDCLSAVDTQTEEQILGNLRRVFEGRTVVLVAHRISTVRHADLILVIEDGRITERGVHQQLIETGGLYATLHQRQLLEEALAAV